MCPNAWHALQLLARSAGIALASLLIFGAMPGKAVAQGGGSQYSTEDTRHFEGERFISLTNVRVYAKPSTEARIVRDIPTLRMVYAKPTRDPAWLQVFGAGVERHPGDRQGVLEPVDADNGKLVLELKRIDRNVYRPFSGYVEASRLSSLDRPLPLPKSFTDQAVPIPRPLESIGVPERRFVPRDPLSHPFRSVVRILSGAGSCTGFVVGRPGLIATSGHCFADGRAEMPISVMLPVPEDGYRKAVAVPARLLYWVHERYAKQANSYDERSFEWSLDSALLEVTASRFADIPPLPLLTPGKWLDAVALQVAVMGFGRDLELVKTHWAKSDALPHVAMCNLSPDQILFGRLGKSQTRALSVVSSNLACIGGPGDSGGPLLLWNTTSSRYEVMGLRTWGVPLDMASDSVLTGDARALVEKARTEQSRTYGRELGLNDLQGASSLKQILDRSTSTHRRLEGWFLDERLYEEVAARTGTPSAFGSLWDAYFESSPLFRLPDDTYIVNHTWYLARFRKARLALSTPVPSADAKQSRTTYGGRLDNISQLKAQGLVVTGLRLGEILELGKPLVLDSEFNDYVKQLRPELDALVKAKPILEKSLPRAIDTVLKYGLVEVGPDLYVVTAKDFIVTEVIRNWMQDVDADGNKRTPKTKSK